jgi:hypothetical protein
MPGFGRRSTSASLQRHRHFEPDDPVQAADIIRTADLVTRMLYDISGQARSSSA